VVADYARPACRLAIGLDGHRRAGVGRKLMRRRRRLVAADLEKLNIAGPRGDCLANCEASRERRIHFRDLPSIRVGSAMGQVAAFLGWRSSPTACPHPHVGRRDLSSNCCAIGRPNGCGYRSAGQLRRRDLDWSVTCRCRHLGSAYPVRSCAIFEDALAAAVSIASSGSACKRRSLIAICKLLAGFRAGKLG